MRFLLATEKLVVQGRSFAGFPLLLDDGGRSMEPAQTFLWDLLSRAGRAQNKATWVKYGRAMYDFCAFCRANNVDWKAPPAPGMPSAIDWYRDWSKGTLALDPRTINQRLRVIVWFHEWALRHGYIQELPFDFKPVQTSRAPGFLAHVDATGGKVLSPAILLREKKQAIKFLSKEQVKACLDDLTNPTHRLMFSLMVRTGLRQVECRSFPERYVFDPTRRKDLIEGQQQMIRVPLDPANMKLKFDKPRDIDVPYRLMEDLWWYAMRHRPKRERKGAGKRPELFLNGSGELYGDQALTDIFSRLEALVGFRVRPHMLRHTYGTYTLLSL